MKDQFKVARLGPNELTEIQQLEQKLRSDSNENIVLIAYAEDHTDTEASPAE